MTAAELLQALRQRGVMLFAVDGSLKYRAATKEIYTDEDRIAVAAVRSELLRLLAAAESIDQPEVPGWDEAKARLTVDDLIALRDAMGRSEGYAMRQEQNAAADEVDRSWRARDAAGLRIAANVFASTFLAFEIDTSPGDFECKSPSQAVGRTVQTVPPWNAGEGIRLFDELDREVEALRKRFGGRPPQPLATLLIDALNIAARFIRDHEAESARGWDAMELLRELLPHVRDVAARWRGANRLQILRH